MRAAISPLTMDCRPAASVARTTSMSGGLNRRGRCRIVDALVEVVIREQPEDAPGLMAEFLLSVHGHPLRLRRLLSPWLSRLATGACLPTSLLVRHLAQPWCCGLSGRGNGPSCARTLSWSRPTGLVRVLHAGAVIALLVVVHDAAYVLLPFARGLPPRVRGPAACRQGTSPSQQLYSTVVRSAGGGGREPGRRVALPPAGGASRRHHR